MKLSDEEFTKLWNDEVLLKEMAYRGECSISNIHIRRKKLGLKSRYQSHPRRQSSQSMCIRIEKSLYDRIKEKAGYRGISALACKILEEHL